MQNEAKDNNFVYVSRYLYSRKPLGLGLPYDDGCQRPTRFRWTAIFEMPPCNTTHLHAIRLVSAAGPLPGRLSNPLLACRVAPIMQPPPADSHQPFAAADAEHASAVALFLLQSAAPVYPPFTPLLKPSRPLSLHM
jgi:hypothetical protein